MKCLQIHNDYIIPGGETKSVNLIASQLEKSGIEVIRYYKDNKDINITTIASKIKFGMKSIYNKDTIKEIKQILDEEEIDFVLIHNISPMISNSIYSIVNRYNKPIYKYIQNYNLVCLNGSLECGELCISCNKNNLIGLKRKCYKNSFLYTMLKLISKKIFDIRYKNNIYKYIAISEFVKERHVNLGVEANKIKVIHHFVTNFNDKLKDNHRDKDKYFLYMGRLSKEKGINTLINAFEELVDKKLIIMGDGELKDTLEYKVKEKKISNIQFIGYKVGREKDEIISNAFATIIPSEWDEPFGRSVIESFQFGVPVIATDRGGLKELITNDINGYKFISGDKNDLINQILKLDNLSEYEYNIMRYNCLSDINLKFSPEAYINKFIELIDFKEVAMK